MRVTQGERRAVRCECAQEIICEGLRPGTGISNKCELSHGFFDKCEDGLETI